MNTSGDRTMQETEAKDGTDSPNMKNRAAEEAVLKIKLLKDIAVEPERKTKGSAGFDLCACIHKEFTINPGEIVIIPTGIAAEIPEGYAGMIYTRSGLGIRHGIHVSNGVGVIDSDYRGEIHVGLTNSGKLPYVVQPGDRIAQLIVMAVLTPRVQLVEELSYTDRGDGGFGSTGK